MTGVKKVRPNSQTVTANFQQEINQFNQNLIWCRRNSFALCSHFGNQRLIVFATGRQLRFSCINISWNCHACSASCHAQRLNLHDKHGSFGARLFRRPITRCLWLLGGGATAAKSRCWRQHIQLRNTISQITARVSSSSSSIVRWSRWARQSCRARSTWQRLVSRKFLNNDLGITQRFDWLNKLAISVVQNAKHDYPAWKINVAYFSERDVTCSPYGNQWTKTARKAFTVSRKGPIFAQGAQQRRIIFSGCLFDYQGSATVDYKIMRELLWKFLEDNSIFICWIHLFA